jgi:hypothetical protein
MHVVPLYEELKTHPELSIDVSALNKKSEKHGKRRNENCV